MAFRTLGCIASLLMVSAKVSPNEMMSAPAPVPPPPYGRYVPDHSFVLHGADGIGRFASAKTWDGKLVVAAKNAERKDHECVTQCGKFKCGGCPGFKDPIAVFDKNTGKFLYSFGAADITKNLATKQPGSHEIDYYPNSYWGVGKIQLQAAEPGVGRPYDRLWVSDDNNFTVTVFELASGKRIQQFGTPGQPASQDTRDFSHFGLVSGIEFQRRDWFTHVYDAVFIGDGERGKNEQNRVLKWNGGEFATGLPKTGMRKSELETSLTQDPAWVTPSEPRIERKQEEFNTPNSIFYLPQPKCLMVGDRGTPNENGHARITFLDQDTGKPTGPDFKCLGMPLSVDRPPIAVAHHHNRKLFYVAVAGLSASPTGPPSVGLWDDNQTIFVLDVNGFDRANPTCTSILQSFTVPKEWCHIISEIAVDEDTGDIYLSCPGIEGSHLRRYRPIDVFPVSNNAVERTDKCKADAVVGRCLIWGCFNNHGPATCHGTQCICNPGMCSYDGWTCVDANATTMSLDLVNTRGSPEVFDQSALLLIVGAVGGFVGTLITFRIGGCLVKRPRTSMRCPLLQ